VALIADAQPDPAFDEYIEIVRRLTVPEKEGSCRVRFFDEASADLPHQLIAQALE
jgi:hypothetical protein